MPSSGPVGNREDKSAWSKTGKCQYAHVPLPKSI